MVHRARAGKAGSHMTDKQTAALIALMTSIERSLRVIASAVEAERDKADK